MEGVSKAPKSYTHGDFEVTVKRHWELPDFPAVTAFSSYLESVVLGSQTL